MGSSGLQKPEKQNPEGCKCTTLHQPAGALVTSLQLRVTYLCVIVSRLSRSLLRNVQIKSRLIMTLTPEVSVYSG